MLWGFLLQQFPPYVLCKSKYYVFGGKTKDFMEDWRGCRNVVCSIVDIIWILLGWFILIYWNLLCLIAENWNWIQLYHFSYISLLPPHGVYTQCLLVDNVIVFSWKKVFLCIYQFFFDYNNLKLASYSIYTLKTFYFIWRRLFEFSLIFKISWIF